MIGKEKNKKVRILKSLKFFCVLLDSLDPFVYFFKRYSSHFLGIFDHHKLALHIQFRIGHHELYKKLRFQKCATFIFYILASK